MQFEKNLVLLRKKQGLSQDELAFLVGVTRQTIYTWEAGLNYPNIVMLKKLASVLDVTTDDLLNGFEVNKLPKVINSLKLTFVGKHEGSIIYDELPNWFISLKPESEVNYALYDVSKDGLVKDYSYHLEYKGNILVHDIEAVELEVKEYDKDLTFTKKYEQYISYKDSGIAWVGEMTYSNGKKTIKTFKDEDFLKDWGYNVGFNYQQVKFENAEDYILEYEGNKQNVTKISYFDNGYYIEVFLNKNNESLVWKRYSLKENKKEYTNDVVTQNNKVYDLDYYCITSRL